MGDNARQITLNGEQKAAAEYEKNVVVAAGAGSGKTSVLANRYACLVTGDRRLAVEQILTLTFTRKAAAEMYQRIYGALSFMAGNEKGEKQKLAQKAVEDFFHARIQTLDSYSSGLARQGSVRYGVSPEFALDEERCRSLAREEALPFLIAHRRHPAVEQLYRRKRPPNSRNGYSVPADIAERFFASTAFAYSHIDDPPDFAEHAQRQFVIIIGEWDKTVKFILDRLGELRDAVSGGDKNDKLIKQLEPIIRRLDSGGIEFPGPGEIKNFFDMLVTLTDSECVLKAENHPVRQKLLQCLVFMNGFHDDLDLRYGKKDSPAKKTVNELRNSFGLFSSLAVFCIQAGIILSLMALLNKFQGIFLEKKRAEGVLTYNDASRLARAILRDHPGIRQSEKETFKAIMIDEFQDNNRLQKDMLFLLAEDEGRQEKSVPKAEELLADKLFFVGDEKQSVYRFRGADVSVFRRLQEELAGGVLRLKTNYRSSPALIGAFNAIFGGSEFDPKGSKPAGVFPSVFIRETDGPASVPPYEALYTPLDSGADRAGGGLTLCLFNKSGSAKAQDEEDGGEGEAPEAEEMGALENEALFTAERIQRLLSEKDDKGNTRYRPDDIAILFRSRSPQKLFEKHLRLLNIPYSGEGGISGFFSDGPVNDIMAVLRLAAYPLDTEAYAVTLRSPFAGLSLQGTAACIAAFNRAKADSARGQGGEAAPFSSGNAEPLSGADREKFLGGQKLYRKTREAASGKTIAETISCLWYDEGYRYETEWNPQTVVYRELYDYLFALAVQADADGKSLAAFTDYLQGLRNSGGRLDDMDIPLERSGAVRLMTVHKSKGLEFPVVFLVCCGSRGRQPGSDADIYETEEGGLSCNPPLPPECSLMGRVRRNFFYEKSRAEEKRKRTAELRRLLYVAMTRAEQELFITGTLALGENDEAAPDDKLPQRLRAAVEKRLSAQAKRDEKNGTARIPGDSVLDNDTFLGLLLPSVAARIPGEAEREPFFKLESIPAYTDEYIKNRERRAAAYFNDQKGLSRFISDTAPYYEKAAILSTPVIPSPYRTPASFRACTEPGDSAGKTGWRFDRENSGESAADVFGQVDSILARHGAMGREEDGFSAADFGTIAHACVESLLNGEDPAIPPKLAGFLGAAEAETLLAAGKTVAERFALSPLGKKAAAAQRKSEYRFRTLCKDSEGETVFINGAIDLLFEDAETVYVVDFKTDSRENPAEHIPQMGFYCRAATELRRKNCRLWLYYLRTGRAVEVTEAAAGGLPAGLSAGQRPGL